MILVGCEMSLNEIGNLLRHAAGGKTTVPQVFIDQARPAPFWAWSAKIPVAPIGVSGIFFVLLGRSSPIQMHYRVASQRPVLIMHPDILMLVIN